MRKVLFIYDSMMTGGTTTALISLLKSIDQSDYDVSLLLYTNDGPYISDIPNYVHVLSQAYVGNSILSSRKRKIVRTILNGQIFKSIKSFIKYRNTSKGNIRTILTHYGMKAQVSLSRKIEESFDYAIGFMEGWANQYVVSSKIDAKKKFIWFHPQYKSCYLIPEIDRKIISKADGVALVSDNCISQFLEYFPECALKVRVIPNIISSELVFQRAKAFNICIKKKDINLCMVSRCDINVKGLDRLLLALSSLKKDGLCNNVLFHYIGGGFELNRFVEDIIRLNLEDVIICYGNQLNPLPYVMKMDLFILTSRYEGKPIAVTEAQILGIPCLVTNYESAKSQINHDENGFIVENSLEGIYNGLKMILQNPHLLDIWKKNMSGCDFGNEKDINKFYHLLK